MRNLFSWYFLLFAGNVCSVFLFILSQSVAVVHYEGALKRRVWLVSMCEATICVVRMCGSTMGLWGCVWLWIVCEDCGACEDNHSLPTNAFAMVSTQRANTVATNNNDNSHNAKYRCNKILNQTDFFKNRSCFTKWGMNDDEVSMKVSELQVLASYFAPPDVYGLPK